MRIESVFRLMVHVIWPWYAPQDERLHDADHRDHHAGHRCGDRSRFRCRILTYSGPSGRPDNPTTAFRAAWLSMSRTDLSSNCAGRSTTPGAWLSRPGRQMDPDLSGSPRCSDLAARRSAFSVTRCRGRSRWITVSLEDPVGRSVRPVRQRPSTTRFRCSRVPTSTTTPLSILTQSRFGWVISRNGSPGRVCGSIRSRIPRQLTTYASRCPLPHDTRPRRL